MQNASEFIEKLPFSVTKCWLIWKKVVFLPPTFQRGETQDNIDISKFRP